MIIASWNVNSVKARLAHLQKWLADTHVDVLCLQEIKGEAAGFPAAELKAMGFEHQQIVGEKSYNGVALLSRTPIADAVIELPGEPEDTKARFVGGSINGVWVFNLYAPNGNPIGTEKFDYKLRWLQRLETFARTAWSREAPAVFCGDFNIIPQPLDAKTPSAWKDDALFQPESRSAYARLLNAGWIDMWRSTHPSEVGYTFFDYRAGAWQKHDGIRIDHFLVSPEAADRSGRCWIDTTPRGWESPSDHTPILLELAA